jgi:site-specific recombinase XerC
MTADDLHRYWQLLNETIDIGLSRFTEQVDRIEAAAEKIAKASEQPKITVSGDGHAVNREQIEALVRDLVERGYSDEQIHSKLSKRRRWRRFRARLKLVLH